MKCNKPYFSKLKYLGDLFLMVTLFYYEEPILFVLTDKSGKKYLCLCTEVRRKKRWLLNEIENRELIDLIENKITIYAALNANKKGTIYIVDLENSFTEYEVLECIKTDVDELDMPDQEEKLDANENEFDDFLHILKSENRELSCDLNVPLDNIIESSEVIDTTMTEVKRESVSVRYLRNDNNAELYFGVTVNKNEMYWQNPRDMYSSVQKKYRNKNLLSFAA